MSKADVEVINAGEFLNPESVADLVAFGVRRFPVRVVGPKEKDQVVIRDRAEAMFFCAGIWFARQPAWNGVEKENTK